ncbi:hypothetical protein [Mitsuaria sp. GD03876]|uniref:hypothetical protein n=1 Tax=Mitsuaria sp. GD03876 TaxID=2975399 RepID=UPI00244C9E23|nr:hypothetical protein [Mitsuaria sp. GD03876]MDH0866791.1 hypothetical protein [Mitsuaria sp. GD03876]
MTIRPEDLQALAEQQSKVIGESWQRSAVSRAYYASYHRCLLWESNLTTAVPPRRRKGSEHQQLLNRLKDPNPACTEVEKRQSTELHRLLSLQRARRVKADYELGQDVSRKEMKRQLSDARELFRECGD